MKHKIKTVFIGNRPSILEALTAHPDIDLVRVFAIKDSMIKEGNAIDGFSFILPSGEKNRILDYLLHGDYALCVSAGCPYIIPVGQCPSDRVFINSHPSVLPLGRGKHPTNECILSGNEIAGATLHYLSEGIDEGDIISQVSFELTDDIDLDVLYAFIFQLECEVFKEGLDKVIRSGMTLPGRPQAGDTTYYSRQEADLRFDLSAGGVKDLLVRVRAFSSDNLGVRVNLDGCELAVHRASPVRNVFLEKRYASTSDGSIALKGSNVLIVKLKDGLVRFDRWRQLSSDG